MVESAPTQSTLALSKYEEESHKCVERRTSFDFQTRCAHVWTKQMQSFILVTLMRMYLSSNRTLYLSVWPNKMRLLSIICCNINNHQCCSLITSPKGGTSRRPLVLFNLRNMAWHVVVQFLVTIWSSCTALGTCKSECKIAARAFEVHNWLHAVPPHLCSGWATHGHSHLGWWRARASDTTNFQF